MMRRKLPRLMAGVMAGGLVSTLVAGCSGGGQEYAVPGKMCGVKIAESALSPLLPDGEKVSDNPSGTVGSMSGCDVIVDNRVRVFVAESAVDKLYDPLTTGEKHDFRNMALVRGLSFAGKAAVGDTGAMVSTECRGPKAKYLVVDVKVDRGVNSDVKQRRKDIKRFAEAYVPNVKKKLDCQA